jgi:hypothetical protein
MNDIDRIAAFANVPRELAELVVIAATRSGSSIGWFRGERRFSELVDGRAWVAREARARGYNFCVIGRALNRDPSSVHNLVKGKKR